MLLQSTAFAPYTATGSGQEGWRHATLADACWRWLAICQRVTRGGQCAQPAACACFCGASQAPATQLRLVLYALTSRMIAGHFFYSKYKGRAPERRPRQRDGDTLLLRLPARHNAVLNEAVGHVNEGCRDVKRGVGQGEVTSRAASEVAPRAAPLKSLHGQPL